MPRAVWNGATLATSDHTEIVEGRHYFPPESVRREYLQLSGTTSMCPWKGGAVYHHIAVGDSVLADGAFEYPDPTPAASHIRGYVAFWKEVDVEV